MRHIRLLRALLGGVGLAGCVGLLAGQARADIVEFVPVRSADPAAISRTENPPSPRLRSAAATAPAKVAPRTPDGRGTDCAGPRIAMAPAKTRAPD
jgi:hypothetical protein